MLVNHKKVYRLYREEKLSVRKRGGRKRALGTRAPLSFRRAATSVGASTSCRTLCAMAGGSACLAIVDDFTRECLALIVDTSLSGGRVARELDRLIETRGRPRSIVSDNGTELTSPAALAVGDRCRLALHPARQTAAERLHRVVQRPATGRMPERDAVLELAGGAPDHRSLADRLQRGTAPHEPQRAHTKRVCKTVQRGP